MTPSHQPSDDSPDSHAQPSVVAPVGLVTAPPGVGKTYAVLSALATQGTRAVYVAPTHDLGEQVQRDLEAMGVTTHRWRGGPSEEDECIKQDDVAFFRGLGYVIRFGPCLKCSKRNACTYRKLFTSKANQSAQVLIVTSWHLRRGDLWGLKAFEDRPLVVLDEDALSAIAAPVELTVDRLRRFVDHLPELRSVFDFINAIGDEAEPIDGVEAVLSLIDVLGRVAEQALRACATATRGRWKMAADVIDDSLTEHERALLVNRDAFDGIITNAYDLARHRVAIPNLISDLRELAVMDGPVHLSLSACRWTRRSSIPRDRQIVMLDATAEPSVVEGVLRRPVDVVNTPPIEHRGTIYQVMDKVGTRAGTRRELESADSWTVRLITQVAKRHARDALVCVTFKDDEQKITELLDSVHGNFSVIHYGALRGINAFEQYGAGLILGRPMPNEAQLQLMAVGAFGREALDEDLRPPELLWRHHTHDIGPDTWTVRCQRYDDPRGRWAAVWRHVVTGELTQAIGRLRPLTNDATIYVATNEPLPYPALDVTPVYAAELFPAMGASNRRSDFQDRVRAYAAAMGELEAAGVTPTNRAVCAKLGIKECNGFRYRKLAVQQPRSPQDGRQVIPRS